MNRDNIITVRKLSQKYAYESIQLHELIARKAGFSATDHKYLGFFVQKGSLTAGELADLTGLTTGAVTGLIDRFEKKKFVKRQLDPNDRRKVIIVPDSNKIIQHLEPYYKKFQDETENLFASYSTAEIEIIESYFEKAIQLIVKTNSTLKNKKAI
ncbi:MarR family winged helix-turn-helix transcriptional regulator [Parapedobacter sp. DT-150]|uniref:MarR family winged helix-turn-helix transcriptional regulator n=1 Tax=Parapedobacter sp. DT-150 TaxID=3396162 RepID=UPI003F1A33C4